METLSSQSIALLKALAETAEHKSGIGGGVVAAPTALNKAFDPKAMGPFWDKDVIKESVAWCEKEGFPLLPFAISVTDGMPMQNREITKMAKDGASLASAALKERWKAEISAIEGLDSGAFAVLRTKLQEVEDAANASKKTESRRILANARVQNVEVSDFETEYAWACDVATKYARCIEHVPEDVPVVVKLSNSTFDDKEEGYKDRYWERAHSDLLGVLESAEAGSGILLDTLQQTLSDNDANWITKTYGGVNLKDILAKHPNGIARFEQEALDFYNDKTTSEHFFNFAQEMLGGQYPVIAHFMFLKDKEQFVPMKPTYFEAGLRRLGIEFYLRGCCSWDNYTKFLGYLEQIRQQLVAKGENPTLLDTHSFLWYIGSGYWRDGEGAKRLEEACKETGQRVKDEPSPIMGDL